MSWTGFRGGSDCRTICPVERDSPVMGRPRKYPEELIERAVRMAVESNRPVAHVAADFGMDGERLRRYAFIDLYRDRFGVEPICRTLGVSCSAYYERAHGRRSARAVEDERLLGVIRELHLANCEAYGYRRMWKALLRAGERFLGAGWRG